LTDSFITLDDFVCNLKGPSRKWTWKIDESQKTTEDFAPFLAKNLVVCLEMELNYKSGVNDYIFEPVCETELGVPADDNMPDCPVCGEEDCTAHTPPKQIRIVKDDCTVRGKEIIVWGSPISSEDFARSLTLENIKKYFAPRPQDSLHTHTLIPHDLRANPIPIQVAQNAWQFFRAYYPAWVHIFGNYRKHFLRSNWAQWKNYSTDAVDASWWPYACHKFQGGLHFSRCLMSLDERKITHFDAEIRTQDATTDLEQVIAARALSKAIFVKSAELGNEGVIEMSEDRKTVILPIIADLNNGCNKTWREGNPYGTRTFDNTLEERHGRFMRELANEFFSQVKPFLSDFEARCVSNCITNPVRFRRRN
jgi:hypothetical protein